MRGPFGEQIPGPFAMAASGLLKTHDRPEYTHRGVRVMRHNAHDLTQVDEYPDATRWYVDETGQLDVLNEDAKVHVVASYPAEKWNRVWFSGAEIKTRLVLTGEDENGEYEDVEPNPS